MSSVVVAETKKNKENIFIFQSDQYQTQYHMLRKSF